MMELFGKATYVSFDFDAALDINRLKFSVTETVDKSVIKIN